MAASGAAAHPDRIVPLRVIVCGVQRTGTLSMRHALYRLGFHGCHHMHSIVENPEVQGPLWVRALKAKFAGEGEFTKEDWDKTIGDCQAVCDVPSALFGPELAAHYPDAKVIILNRDAERWYESVLNSIHSDKPTSLKLSMIFCLLLDSATRAWMGFGMAMGKYGFGFDHRSQKPEAMAWYQRTYDDFRERIPANRRIEYTVGDGWEPLCKHLEVPVPLIQDSEGKMVEAPFPWLNDREAWRAERREVLQKSINRSVNNLFTLIGKTVVTGSTVYVCYLAWRTRLGGRV